MDDSATASIAKALAHPARLHIVRLLAAQTECRGADVFSELPLAQSTISEHLRVLKDAGLVHSRADGTSMLYCLVPDLLESFAAEVLMMARSAVVCGSDTKGC
jgi:ArsR family transcriptional regulator